MPQHPSLTLGVRVAVAAILLPLVALPVTVAAQQALSSAFPPVTDAMLQNPAPADWLTWRRTLYGWGYSPLDQRSVQGLRPAPPE